MLRTWESLPSGPVSTWTLDSIHSDVYPFLDASPDSNSSVPADIFKKFTSVFSKKQSDKLPIHREFDCTIDLVPNAAPHHVFTTLDLRGAYNLLRIKEGDEPKTAFITKYGQFEFLVMPFGLANAPAQFQRMMNTLFRDSIGKFVLVYLDDIVVYSEDLETHKEHVKSVLAILSKNGLYCKLEKCHFYQQNQLSWFFLAHPCDSKPFILETDASDFAISGVLSQFDDLDQIRPVAFYARQMNSAERNYEIYDKELLAIVDVVQALETLFARWSPSSHGTLRS
ncbi:hypothetical protein BASA81_011366 [Batrachochytrium salamandrivorans]|nr:hypothetical protein BASA81_011366 [Batrachochytrium salamandrivorans]